jgi:predicted RNase H-like HicB family nuclease
MKSLCRQDAGIMRKFTVILILEDDGRWTAEVPSLPGCVTWGNTQQQALERIKEAIELYLEVLINDGKPIPEDRSVLTRIEVAM